MTRYGGRNPGDFSLVIGNSTSRATAETRLFIWMDFDNVDIKTELLSAIAADTTLYGMVPSAADKEQVLKLVQKRVGEHYVVIDNVFVSEVLWDG